MNCKNCGAPMLLKREQDYFFCEYCSSFYFPEKNRDGVRVLEAPTDINCPTCRKRLVEASVFGMAVMYCPNCRGVLVKQSLFPFLVEALRAEASGPPDQPRLINPEELERKLACPSCGKLLDTHPYYGPGNIVIDVCVRCGLIWLDMGELRRIMNAPGRDRGRWSTIE